MVNISYTVKKKSYLYKNKCHHIAPLFNKAQVALHNQQDKIQFLSCGDLTLVSVSTGSQVVPTVKATVTQPKWCTVNALKPLLKCDAGMDPENLEAQVSISTVFFVSIINVNIYISLTVSQYSLNIFCVLIHLMLITAL